MKKRTFWAFIEVIQRPFYGIYLICTFFKGFFNFQIHEWPFFCFWLQNSWSRFSPWPKGIYIMLGFVKFFRNRSLFSFPLHFVSAINIKHLVFSYGWWLIPFCQILMLTFSEFLVMKLVTKSPLFLWKLDFHKNPKNNPVCSKGPYTTSFLRAVIEAFSW